MKSEAWPMGTQSGWNIKLCSCEEGEYIGTRQMGQADRCERCGFMTQAQWNHIVRTVSAAAWDEGAAAASPHGGGYLRSLYACNPYRDVR